MTGDQDAKKIEDELQANLWYMQLTASIKNGIENIKNLFQGVTRSIEEAKPKMWTSKVVTEFMNGSYQQLQLQLYSRNFAIFDCSDLSKGC